MYLVVSDKNGESKTDNCLILVKDNKNIASFRVDTRIQNSSIGHTDWFVSVVAKPGDKIRFKIMATSDGNKAPEDVKVKIVLPAKLIYSGDLTIDNVSQNREEDITKGIEIGVMQLNQTKTILFSAEVANEEKFNLDKTELVATAVVFNDENSEAGSFVVVVSEQGILGAINNAGEISTGIGATILTSVLFPLAIAVLLVWFFKSPLLGLDMVAEKRKNKVNNYRIKKKLEKLKKNW